MDPNVVVTIISLVVLLVVVPGIIIGLIVPLSLRRNRYTNFVNAHSEALKTIREMNARYKFASIPNYNMEHTYDNNDFYPNVSPQDYLIYQLVYMEKKVSKSIKDAENNKEKYISYRDELSHVYLKHYDIETTGYKTKTLDKYEKRMVRKTIQVPIVVLAIKVTLKRTDIGGNYKESKCQVFYQDTIKEIIKQLHQKEGSYYLNPEIWNAIVRVERAKVSNKMRFAVFSRDHNRCRRCGSTRNLEVDHIYPISKGGKTEMKNLQTLCHRCNVRKGNSVEW